MLLATHGADILDDKDVSPDDVLVFEADDGVTRIGPMDAGAAELIRGRKATVGEFLRIGQLFPAQDVPSGAAGAAS